jgi:hypothetical protein
MYNDIVGYVEKIFNITFVLLKYNFRRYMKLYFYIIAIIISVTIKANYYYDSFNNKVEFKTSKNYIAFIITKEKKKVLETIIKENNYIIEEKIILIILISLKYLLKI